MVLQGNSRFRLCSNEHVSFNTIFAKIDPSGAPVSNSLLTQRKDTVTMCRKLHIWHSIIKRVRDATSSMRWLSCRAPELFDVPSHCTIDQRIDIWSLGTSLGSDPSRLLVYLVRDALSNQSCIRCQQPLCARSFIMSFFCIIVSPYPEDVRLQLPRRIYTISFVRQ